MKTRKVEILTEGMKKVGGTETELDRTEKTQRSGGRNKRPRVSPERTERDPSRLSDGLRSPDGSTLFSTLTLPMQTELSWLEARPQRLPRKDRRGLVGQDSGLRWIERKRSLPDLPVSKSLPLCREDKDFRLPGKARLHTLDAKIATKKNWGTVIIPLSVWMRKRETNLGLITLLDNSVH
ncbi:unnamed protein product [Calypogeia fissa]